MQITHLFLFSCLFYVSVCNVQNINKIEEFKKYFMDYMNQTSSNASKTFYPVLSNMVNVCQCAYSQMQKIHDKFGNQNSTEVLLMKKTLKSLMNQVPNKQIGCQFKLINSGITQKYETFFRQFLFRKCASRS